MRAGLNISAANSTVWDNRRSKPDSAPGHEGAVETHVRRRTPAVRTGSGAAGLAAHVPSPNFWLPGHAPMLRELSVQNLALIEDVRVELQPGFCAWTGETGAGKSLLLGRPRPAARRARLRRPAPRRRRRAAHHRPLRADHARAAAARSKRILDAPLRGRRGHPRPPPEPRRPQLRLRQRPAGRRRHAQAARRAARRHPRPAREPVAAGAGLPAAAARRLRPPGEACARRTSTWPSSVREPAAPLTAPVGASGSSGSASWRCCASSARSWTRPPWSPASWPS